MIKVKYKKHISGPKLPFHYHIFVMKVNHKCIIVIVYGIHRCWQDLVLCHRANERRL